MNKRSLPFNTNINDIENLHNIFAGRIVSAAILAIAKLKIADYLDEVPISCRKLARLTNTNEEYLYRLLRVIVNVGIFIETKNKYFKINPMGVLLRSNSTPSLYDIVLMCGTNCFWNILTGLSNTIKTGVPCFSQYFGDNFYNYITKNQDMAEIFNKGMASLSSLSNLAIAKSYPFENFKVIADIGGGSGGLLAAILTENQACKGILFDLPSVVTMAKNHLKDYRINNRYKVLGGDFFKKIPSGADLYIVKHVLHGLDKCQCNKILVNIAKVMPKNGVLLIIEMLVSNNSGLSYSKLNDLIMMLISDKGKERDEQEYKSILHDTGLMIRNIFPVQMGIHIIEVIKTTR